MALTPTAQRMLETLPDYYWDNEIIARVLQARANEIDRIDARLDTLKNGLIPGFATDELRLLSVWERILRLPVNPPDATLSQRQQAVKSALLITVTTAADVLDMIEAAIGPGFSVKRNTPAQLEDTIFIRFLPGSYSAAQVERIARRAWSAHRRVLIHYADGFILDVSLLDEDTL